MKKVGLILLITITTLLMLGCRASTGSTNLVLNPYENVDWRTVNHVLANLHTHTTHSDGFSDPHDVVDYYHQFGYGILAITDHDLITYPWSFSNINNLWQDRLPESLGMLAISGNEYSYNHHLVGLFTEYIAALNEPFDTTLENLFEQNDALGWFAHPGRYWRIYTEYQPGDLYSPEWYLAYFEAYPADRMLGIEVFNRQNNRPYDRSLWDLLLSESMPERPIWGFAADDFHGDTAGQRMRWSFTHHLMEDRLDKSEFRQGLIDGAFYISYTALEDDTAPKIERIIVNTRQRYIEIVATDYVFINWVSGNEEIINTSRIIHTGNRFYYGNFAGNYVRAEIIKVESGASASMTYTQPFGFSTE